VCGIDADNARGALRKKERSQNPKCGARAVSRDEQRSDVKEDRMHLLLGLTEVEGAGEETNPLESLQERLASLDAALMAARFSLAAPTPARVVMAGRAGRRLGALESGYPGAA
jgi:hypothetical protein